MKGYFDTKITEALTLASGQGYTVSYEYDEAGRIVKETVIGAINREVSYSYDANDNITTETINVDGKTIMKSYSYDRNSNISTIAVAVL